MRREKNPQGSSTYLVHQNETGEELVRFFDLLSLIERNLRGIKFSIAGSGFDPFFLFILVIFSTPLYVFP
jgi:hypothetical protein